MVSNEQWEQWEADVSRRDPDGRLLDPGPLTPPEDVECPDAWHYDGDHEDQCPSRCPTCGLRCDQVQPQ